jgi:anti-sigma B factor antagonist
MTAAVIPSYQPFAVTVVPDRGSVAVIPEGDLDLATADRLAGEVRELRGAGFEDVVLDLRRLDFMDSTGLHLLLGLRSDARRSGQTLTLVPGCAEVQRLFELTATLDLFDWRRA